MSWPLVKLGDICDLFNGYAFKSTDYVDESNTLSCRMSNIRPGGKFDIEYNARYLPDSFVEKYKQFLLKDGDVVIAMTDLADSPKILGVPTIIKTDGRDILLNQRVGKLIIKEQNKVYFPYLQIALNSSKVRSVYKRFAGGGLQINLGKEDLLSVEIPLPSLPEQQKIASILNAADNLRQKDQQLIEKYTALSQSLFLEMFGDPVSNPMGWDKIELEEIADIVSGVTKGRKLKSKANLNIPYMRVANVQDGHLNLQEIKTIPGTEEDIQKFGLHKGDILLTEGGDPDKLGRGTVWNDEIENCIHQNHIFRVRLLCNKSTPIYLSKLCGSEYGKRYFLKLGKQTTGIASINKTQLRKFPVLRPPINLQNQYAERILAIEAQKQLALAGLEKSEALFNSLLQRAFKGELTV